jgi:hypothetical protein
LTYSRDGDAFVVAGTAGGSKKDQPGSPTAGHADGHDRRRRSGRQATASVAEADRDRL